MGGRAFLESMPDAIFPRLPPETYFALKERLKLLLETIYQRVSVPREAPEKYDYGDIDFTVVNPIIPHESAPSATLSAIGAAKVIANPGTSNYALRLRDLFPEESDNKYVQVDVHICPDEADLERVLFWHGYGDLGMIVGSMIRSYGLSAGTSGIKIMKVPDGIQPYLLAMQPSDIMPFLELTLERWEQGFATRMEAFEWVSTSILFNPKRLEPPGDKGNAASRNTKSRHRDGRAMYQQFLEWASQQSARSDVPASKEEAISRALDFYGKRQAYDETIELAHRRKKNKAVWGQGRVKEWLELEDTPEGWGAAKAVMREVRKRANGEEGVAALGDEEAVKRYVVDCAREMGIGQQRCLGA